MLRFDERMSGSIFVLIYVFMFLLKKQTIIDLRQEFFTKQEQFKNPSKALVQRLVKQFSIL